MDYGSFLKTQVANPSRASKHHNRQARFEGSLRQLRGQVLKALLEGPVPLEQLTKILPDTRLSTALKALQKDDMIVLENSVVRLR